MALVVGWLLNDKITETTFEGQGTLLKAERAYHQDKIARQETMLSTMENSKDALDAMLNVRDRLATRVEVGDKTTLSIGTNQIKTPVMHSGKSFLAEFTRVETM